MSGRGSGAFSGRWPEAGSPSGREPGALFGLDGPAQAAASFAGTAEKRPFFADGPATELLPEATPDPDRPLPASWEDPDFWEHPDEPANSRDRHEVTIQLDGAGRKPDGRPVQRAKDAPTTPEASDGPVFVDESGRRSRRFRRLGMLVAVACAVYAVVIVATLLSGNSNAPWLPVPGQEEDQPVGQVDTSPLPSQSVNPSGRGSATAPGAVATAGNGTTTSPGSAVTPSASADATAPGASSDPKPTASATKKPKPGVVTNAPDPDPDPEPSSSVANPPPASTPATTPGSTAAPTETAGTGGAPGAGTGTQ
ncbi:hypothetical protein [Streptomyces rhizosphaerihabitans]|uniref:hypothetical protein n=1 Tax=Streptomyces rhizosphaerihabitans TaxID=1266770 RepID=UPI0021C06ECE|nr:hypothetical protein [Streptomyces rhizosphaerihabitans]MCT9011396.1 hypothetical protein [Streptomyces rhizosphaerihabitans]